MNAEYRVILERREPGKIPVISPYSVSKAKYDECQKIVHKNPVGAHR
jgi:hypothetical protein